MHDPDPETVENLDLDLLDFDEEDRRDADHAVDFRTLTTGLPARPGTLR